MSSRFSSPDWKLARRSVSDDRASLPSSPCEAIEAASSSSSLLSSSLSSSLWVSSFGMGGPGGGAPTTWTLRVLEDEAVGSADVWGTVGCSSDDILRVATLSSVKVASEKCWTRLGSDEDVERQATITQSIVRPSVLGSLTLDRTDMATAKIATLLIRTLAKPIATQLKTQAASHESFRRVCIGIAQTMHKTEMALRYNLLPKAAPLPSSTSSSESDGKKDGEESSHSHSHRPKVRPLNEAKAIANGANFLSEAFLFSIAATLLILESWRSSYKSKQQRKQNADGIERMETALRKLCALHGLDPRVLGLEDEGEEGGEAESEDKTIDDDAKQEAHRHAAAMQHRLHEEREQTRRLQLAVDALLRMAIKNGTIMGGEALDLQGILDGKQASSTEQDGGNDSTQNSAPSSQPIATSPILAEVARTKARAAAQDSST